jgi:hypothetical protein
LRVSVNWNVRFGVVRNSKMSSDEDIADGDIQWFDAHPTRRFRAKRNSHGHIWLVRRRPSAPIDVFLRTPVKATPAPDTDLVIGTAWYIAAWGMPLVTAAAAARKAIKKGGGK